ncbi:MAG: uracil-DNA glycosylase [Candidatus Jorgensenbacteria bacterium]
MTKTESLHALEDELARDEELPLRESNLVFGEGSPDAAVMFIGEAPGFYENQLKRPFVGRAGQLLDKLILGLGWKREDVYITNIVKRRPPENRDPSPQEIAAYAPYLARQIDIIAPKVIAPLGRFAMNYFLPEAKISRDQGKLFRVGNNYIYPLFHTAAALRSTQTLKELTEAFQKLPAVIAKREELAAPVEVPWDKEEKQKPLF